MSKSVPGRIGGGRRLGLVGVRHDGAVLRRGPSAASDRYGGSRTTAASSRHAFRNIHFAIFKQKTTDAALSATLAPVFVPSVLAKVLLVGCSEAGGEWRLGDLVCSGPET